MDRRERYPDAEEALRVALDGSQAQLWTALPGIVQSFNPVAMTAQVQPTINGLVRLQDGTFRELQMPLLLDCPVVFPGGGGVTLTFPVQPGDEVLVVFASRCIDSWWQLGGVQGQAELRMHDLSDGFVIPQVRSQPRRFTVSTTAAELRTDDGTAFVRLEVASKAVTVETPSTVEATADGGATITAPTIVLNGNVTINGTLTQAGGGAATFSGSITATGDIVGAGTSLDGHTHGGVAPGSGNTAPPN